MTYSNKFWLIYIFLWKQKFFITLNSLFFFNDSNPKHSLLFETFFTHINFVLFTVFKYIHAYTHTHTSIYHNFSKQKKKVMKRRKILSQLLLLLFLHIYTNILIRLKYFKWNLVFIIWKDKEILLIQCFVNNVVIIFALKIR